MAHHHRGHLLLFLLIPYFFIKALFEIPYLTIKLIYLWFCLFSNLSLLAFNFGRQMAAESQEP